MNNKYRKSGLYYFIAAACFFIVGVIGIIDGGTVPYSFIGLSCAFVCLGCVNLAKAKKEPEEKNEDQEQDKAE